ncbi:MAG: protein disulfide oxidoreductase [Epsilonproteobacteria bacterium]|nr:MAG: protein disulfide oxidoreductase [Campylobacterota bacterium]
MISRIKSKNWNWRSILKEILIVIVLMFILSNIMSYLRKPDLDSSQLPKIELQLLDGSIFTVPKDQPILIHFWALWCPTCKLEASNIEAVSKKYKVLSIAVDSGSDTKVKEYMQEQNLSFKVFNDRDGTWAKQFKVEMYPTTFIYDSQGQLRFSEVGYTSTAGLLARFEWIK